MMPTLNIAVKTMAIAASEDTDWRTIRVRMTAANSAATIAPANSPSRPPQTKPMAIPGKTA